jgi:hypothetical protein
LSPSRPVSSEGSWDRVKERTAVATDWCRRDRCVAPTGRAGRASTGSGSMFAHTREGRLTWWISPEAGPNAPAVVAPHRPGVHRLGVGAIAGPAQRLASKMPIQLHLHAYRLQPGAEGSEVQYAVPKSTPETFEPSCAVLPPHPRWRWGLYPLRWLVGGLWGLGQAPMLGLLYGSIFFATGWTWRLTLADLTPARFGLSIARFYPR